MLNRSFITRIIGKKQEAGPYDIHSPAEDPVASGSIETIQRLVRSTYDDNRVEKETTRDFVTRILKSPTNVPSSSVSSSSRHGDNRQKLNAKSIYMCDGRGSAVVGNGGATFSYYPTHLPHDTDTTPSNTHYPPLHPTTTSPPDGEK